MGERDITLVVTSCGRYDLLARTLESLYAYVPFDTFAEVIIAEDWEREGQVRNIDRAYARVKTPYIMACEDDWEFYRGDFVDQSLDLLESYPEILQVQLRAHGDVNGHPVIYSDSYFLMDPHWTWGGFSWNPGLRRLADWMKIGGYWNHWQGTDNKTEKHLSELYARAGMVAAILPEKEGYVRHIGGGRSLQK